MLKYKEIFLGNACNNRCLHCSYRGGNPSHIGLPAILDSLTKKEGDGILFYGGEPTLRSDLIQILRAAKETGYRRIKLFTNGRALSDMQFLYQLMKAGCYLFEIKLWASSPSLHDHLTQTENSFPETIRGLENLAGLPDEKFVCVRIPVCNENLSDIENSVITALNFGVNRIILSLQDYRSAFQTVLPHIKNAINISIFNRIWILTEGLPFCIMQGLEKHMSEIYQGWDTLYEKNFNRHKYCMDCVYHDFCPGVASSYLETFGDKDFVPVAAHTYAEDIKKLYA
jgi:sulfatase maturation enzyme AslB (radical SAM superfamily)